MFVLVTSGFLSVLADMSCLLPVIYQGTLIKDFGILDPHSGLVGKKF